MDKNIPDDVTPPQTPEPNPPAHDNDDVQRFSTWMAEYGRPALIGLAVAVVALLGIQIWHGQKTSKAAAAVQALFQSRSPEELQQLATTDPQAPTAPMALASAAAEFYAQNRYDEALAAYRSFLAQYPAHMLAPQAELGAAASLEALDDFEAAVAGYVAFAEKRTESPLRPQAVFGAARCLEQLDRFAEARALYEDFIAANPDSDQLAQAESGLLFLKKAERAKNAPARPAAPEVVFDSSRDAAAAEEVAAPAAAAEEKTAQKESKPKKKSSKKKPAAEKPVAEPAAAEPAAE
ncbi:MAG TPA: tetratricopeptide repeat protein [Kiritimatiellia bacterium]|mgnify:CR=1 FL=1|nr:tetratricopeptide repeat protein [Kiritimatiellia bacterium]